MTGDTKANTNETNSLRASPSIVNMEFAIITLKLITPLPSSGVRILLSTELAYCSRRPFTPTADKHIS